MPGTALRPYRGLLLSTAGYGRQVERRYQRKTTYLTKNVHLHVSPYQREITVELWLTPSRSRLLSINLQGLWIAVHLCDECRRGYVDHLLPHSREREQWTMFTSTIATPLTITEKKKRIKTYIALSKNLSGLVARWIPLPSHGTHEETCGGRRAVPELLDDLDAR